MSASPPFSQEADISEIVDGQGRHLTIRQPHALDQLRLFKAVGPILAQNQPYLGMAIVACSVISIDGVPVPPAVTEAQIESLVTKLGDAGMQAAGDALAREPEMAEFQAQAGN